MARRPRDPFEVKLDEKEAETLCARLSDEITEALTARERIVGNDQQLDAWHTVYEGGDRRISKDTPWPGAANLTSWIGTEKVDAFRSRVVKTIFSEPIWVVSGWDMDPARVARVEAFHQWKAEEERLQGYLSKVVHNGLIEGTGVLEVSERPAIRKVRQRMKALRMMNEQGIPVGDAATGQPVPQVDENGSPVEAPPDAPDDQTTGIIIDRITKVRSGPQYRILSLKDFLILPGHAQEKKDVWGYAKRVWKRLPELTLLQQMGVYQNVEQLGAEDEREITPEMTREGQGLANQYGPTAEKEIWEITFLDDCDHDGIQEWYIATLHIGKRVLLRLQRDDLGQARYLLFTPFPRTRFIYGYSLVGHKLETIIDEHTAWRNMIADRAKLVINAPIKRLVGSLWNPQAVPWGPGAVMPVRDMGEIEGMTIPDVPSSAVHREQMILSASERVAGMVDTAAGVHPSEDRTLGEVKTVMGESLIRIDEVVKHLQESMEDLFQIRHEIWKRTIRENPQDLPADLMASMEAKNISASPQLIQPGDLEGIFRGKPHGSVDTADTAVMRADFIQFLTAITQFSQSVPTFGVLFQDPELGKQLLSQAVRVFRWENPQAIMDAINRATEKAKQQIAMQGVPGPAGAPGAGGPAPGPNAMTSAMTPPAAAPKGPRGRPPAGQ